MFDVFLSYRRETGTECCSILQKSLEEDEYIVFFDRHSIRQGPFEKQIENAIKECSYLLVMLSPDDLNRCFENPEEDWIIHEIKIAIEYGKIIIPVSFKEGFVFPSNCNEIPELKYLSKEQLCDISGTEFSYLMKTKIYDFMNDSPVKKLRDDYHNGIKQKEYLEWEIQSLRAIYSDLEFINEFGEEHPEIVFEGSSQVSYPFDSLNEQENLLPIVEPINFRDFPHYEEFKKIVGPNIHYPDLYGFTNVGLLFDEEGKVSGFKAIPRTYKETVFSSHILHYELWCAFQKTAGKRPATLDDLPIRKMIHGNSSNMDVIISGCRRSALCDVCLAVLAYDREENDYDIAIATRSSNVACFPGYLSIIPSGGFELYELEHNQSISVIRKNFSIRAAVFREYIEEIFGNTEFEEPTGNDDLKRILRDSHIKELREKLDKTFFFEFLGVSYDVLTLRPSFTFVLRIDDPDFLYNNDVRFNYENIWIKNISLSELEVFIKERRDTNPLMHESAGVYNLLKRNHLYIEAIENKTSAQV